MVLKPPTSGTHPAATGWVPTIMPPPPRPCPQRDETHRGCPRRVPGASRGTARENRGAVAGMGSGLPGAGQGRDHWEVRRGGARRRRRRTRDGCRRGVCSVTGWSRDNARRRLVAAAGRPPGRGRPEPGGRARKYSYDALKILQRVWAAGGGQCGKRLKESMPAGRTCWRRGGEIRRRAPPRTRPSGPGGHERGDHRPLSRPGRGPRRARPVHGQGPVPAFAAPSRSAGPAGEVEAEPGPRRGPSPSPTAVRCSRGSSPGPLSTT